MNADERGMTVIELTVVAGIMLVLLAAILGVLDSTTRNERVQQARIANQEAVRLAMITVAKDIRSANFPNPLGDPTAYASTFEASLGPRGSVQAHVRWRLDGTTLRRELVSAPGSTASSSTAVLEGVASPPFRYFDEAGSEITSPALAADFVNCAIRVRVSLTALPDDRAPAFRAVNDVEIRNRLPGGIGCTGAATTT